MRSFILHNVRSLVVSPTYVGVLAVYLSFAWFLSDPSFDPNAIYSTEKLTNNYDLMLMSIMLVNYLLFVMHHFRGEARAPRRDIVASRLTSRQLLWGLAVSYLVFFIVGFVVPTYLVAFIQQVLYAPSNVRWSVFVLKALSGLFGYTLLWTFAAILCVTRIRNEFASLVFLSLGYAGSQVLNFFTQGSWFNQYWLAKAAQTDTFWTDNRAGLIWCCAMVLSIVIGVLLQKTILRVEVNEPYRKGVLSRFVEGLGADLAMHHYRMMGLSSQKILTFFSAGGLLMLIPLVRRTDVNLVPLAKVYLGAFIPLLFSFNQYFLIKIDRDAEMTHNNFLRRLSYPRIIFNRWLLLLAPQLGAQLVFVLAASVFGQPLSSSFVLYVLLLGVLCSAANLYFAVATMTNVVANLFLVFVVYLQLRDDVQRILASNGLLTQLNVLGVLVDPQLGSPPVVHWLVAGALIAACLFLTLRRLRIVSFVDLAM